VPHLLNSPRGPQYRRLVPEPGRQLPPVKPHRIAQKPDLQLRRGQHSRFVRSPRFIPHYRPVRKPGRRLRHIRHRNQRKSGKNTSEGLNLTQVNLWFDVTEPSRHLVVHR
jgi:hypothetical protein